MSRQIWPPWLGTRSSTPRNKLRRQSKHAWGARFRFAMIGFTIADARRTLFKTSLMAKQARGYATSGCSLKTSTTIWIPIGLYEEGIWLSEVSTHRYFSDCFCDVTIHFEV